MSGQIQRSIEILPVIHPWYDDREFGRVMAATRAIPRVSVKAHGHTRSITSGETAKITSTFAKTSNHTQTVVLNYQTQHRANPMHQPLKLASGPLRLSRAVVVGFLSLITTATLPSSQLWVFLFHHMAKRSHIYRRRGVVQATNDAIRRQRSDKSKPGIGRPIAFPMVCQEFTSHRTRSVTFGSLLLGAKKRATCFVVIWTQRVP